MDMQSSEESVISMAPALRKKSKIFYIDNLRILLTILVVLHHAAITYGAPGGWYFTEKTNLLPALILLTLFVASNQSFFMGLFFFLSGLFIEPSLDKKGPMRFLLDRLTRLGIPLIFYSIVLSPLLNYMTEHYGRGEHSTFREYMSGYHHWIDFGVLWFVAALLLFSLLFMTLKRWLPSGPVRKFSFPGNGSLIGIAISLGLITYLVRGYFPVGWTLKPVGFQLAHFPQYVVFFIAGILATRNEWLERITFLRGKNALRIALIFGVVVFPALYFVKMATNSSAESFQGGFTWQSLLAAEWEQGMGICLAVGLLGIARQKWNSSTPLLSTLARSSYGVYIIHPVLLIGLSVALHAVPIEPVLKLLVVGPAAVVSSFVVGWGLLSIPFVRDVI